MHQARIKLSRFKSLFNFCNRDLSRGLHHRIKIARRLAINKIAPFIALPGLDEGEVSFQRVFHDVSAPVKLAPLLTFGDHSSDAGGRKERRNASTTCSNALGKCSLRDQIELHSPLQYHFLQKPIFADVSPNVLADLPVRQKQSHAKSVDASIIADRSEVLDALLGQRANQVL